MLLGGDLQRQEEPFPPWTSWAALGCAWLRILFLNHLALLLKRWHYLSTKVSSNVHHFQMHELSLPSLGFSSPKPKGLGWGCPLYSPL